MTYLLKNIIELLFPTKCVSCKKRGETLCDNCISKINRSEKLNLENINYIFDYKDPIIKRAIWSLKYHNQKQIGIKLGQILYNDFIEEISEMKQFSLGQSILVVPVPISKKRKGGRGYNQSLIIAKSFCDCDLGKNLQLLDNIVIKKIDTVPQALIKNKKERLLNIRGAFDLKDRKSVEGRIVIIIDDVTTTGGTINEISKILKKAKARKIFPIAVAH